MNNLIPIFLSGGLSALLVLAVVFLARNWITIRLKSSIQHEYDEKAKALDFAYGEKLKAIEHGYNEQLEKLRVQLQNESAIANSRLTAELEHDKKLFEKLTSIVDETTFRDVCYGIGNYEFYDYKEYRKVMDFEHYVGLVENQFLNKALQNEFLGLFKTLDVFTLIVARFFFATNDERFVLYPELKYSDDEEKRKVYEDALNETQKASDNVLAAYTSFRQTVKQVLCI